VAVVFLEGAFLWFALTNFNNLFEVYGVAKTVSKRQARESLLHVFNAVDDVRANNDA
jgi:hypothetical protein